MDNGQFLEKIIEDFNFFGDKNDIELETWTDGGVNMFVRLDKESDVPYAEQFKKHIEEFDIDEQIDLHRQADDYKQAFTIRESLEDFTAYKEQLKSVLKKALGEEE